MKRWVLAYEPDIEWATFSSSLVDAPLTEQVAVCVLTKTDGELFDPGAGEEPVQSVVLIVRPNAEATIFIIGSLDTTLTETPKNFDRYR